MHRASRRHIIFIVSSVAFTLLLIYNQASNLRRQDHYALRNVVHNGVDNSTTERYPVLSYQVVPPPGRRKLPRIQHRFDRHLRPQYDRRDAVKQAFVRCWNAYREHAWLADELMPLTGQDKDHFSGWAATLVDTLDTLWIMDLKPQFWEAVEAAVTIDFTMPTTDDTDISLFETTIRYLGGLLAAYDLSGDARLLSKAVGLGDALYGAFDTPNRMPISHWNMKAATDGRPQSAGTTSLADIGSLTLEFTRLSQLTKNPKYYDAVARITDAFATQQNVSSLPGMWPQRVNANNVDFHTGTSFPLGAMADSMYEYLPKMGLLLHGSDLYEAMYKMAADTIVGHSLFRPMVPDEAEILMIGKVNVFDDGEPRLDPSIEHLGCFAGGMLALGGRLLDNATHIDIGRRLAAGCVWAYQASPLGIMPEDSMMMPCPNQTSCAWDEALWREQLKQHGFGSPDSPNNQTLPAGMTSITNRHYILRPEAIESVFILYRITGDTAFRDAAWRMFESIQNATRTDIANAALSDVMDPAAPKMDEMESFWLAETLKYFYLIFSEPDLISLNEFVFNTEAHPLRRPQRGFWGWG